MNIIIPYKQLKPPMQHRLQLTPDIEQKFDQLLTHMTTKNKITDELTKILQQICNFQIFYSKTLDNFANNISKILVGQDPIKDILIILERIISSKSQQSQKLANSIKDDLIPHLKNSVNSKTQDMFKEKQTAVKNIRNSMQKKIRLLYSSESSFKKAVSQLNNLPKILGRQQKKQAQEAYQKKQQQFSDTIDSYNSSLNDYMIKYTQICEQLSQLETNRKLQYRDSISKLVIFQLNYIKNLQYNFAKYMDSLNKMQCKLTIENRIINAAQPFYSTKQYTGPIHLATISNKNYIDNVIGKKKITSNLISQQVKLTELKSTYQPGQVTKQIYHNLAKTIFPIMTYIQKNNHTTLLIQTVLFSKNIIYTKGKIKISLLTSLLCHQLLQDQKFWINYQKRIIDKMMRQQTLGTKDQQTLLKNFTKVLQRDLQMLHLIQINPYITKLIQTINQKYKSMFQPKKNSSSINDLQKIQTDLPNPSQIQKINLPIIKYQIQQ